jgi:glucose-6-phosphate 1-dehydrogenase
LDLQEALMVREEEACVGCELEAEPGPASPAAIVIFGATGDLAARKIIPALYNLDRSGRFHAASRVIGVGRRPMTTEFFRGSLAESTRGFSHSGFDPAVWAKLAARIDYLEGDMADDKLYSRLAARLVEPGMPPDRIFYLAVGPDQFAPTALALARAGLGSASFSSATERPSSRLVVEKPYGRDLESARALTRFLHEAFAEKDIFRIDHYLGKETVQNLLYLRFANSIFEPLWNRNYIEGVEIEVLETGGIGSRGGYYDGAGAARDMLQNHLVQLLCLTAMEPPSSLDPEALRDEKVKVLRALPRYANEDYLARSVRGRYSAGRSPAGIAIPDYVAEERIRPGSATETYVAVRLELDNWRFAGVPFVLRTGKALDRQVSEIRIHFRQPPQSLFSLPAGETLSRNVLVLRIQPDEGLWLSFNAKVPGQTRVNRSELRFSYREADDYFPEAYERLLDDAIAGDSTLFIRADEAEAAWSLVDGLEAAWRSPGAAKPIDYPAGSAPLPLPGEVVR